MSRLAAFAVLCFLSTGCLVFKTGPVEMNETPGERKEKSVSAAPGATLRTIIRSRSGRAALFLEVVGDIDVVYSQEVAVEEARRGRTSFGFFPWTLADRPGSVPVADHLMALIVNYGLVFTPTLYSLLIEPFSSYPENGINDHVFARFGIFGFYRYVDDPTVVRRYTTSTGETGSREFHRFKGFSVIYDGKVLSDGGQGWIGLPLPYSSGMEISCRLNGVHVPAGNLGGFPPVGKVLVWRSTGRKAVPVDAVTASSPAPAAVGDPVTAAELTGTWEMYQSHISAISTDGGTKRNFNSVIYAVYRFLKDGSLEIETTSAGKTTSGSGTWTCELGVLKMVAAGTDGISRKIDMTIRRRDGGTLELQYARPADYGKMFPMRGFEPANARYNEKRELVVRMTTETGAAGGRAGRTEMESVYSPMVLERMTD